ncbi:hypothetical protein Ae168Ps1_0600c [Pseudonocardia sp. Ae168_Ps1]|nr:hypothetical protein Ae150APs1_0603c [Pseudonocardia sp. Ae150A_Ps1]OLL78194.1 hypothetical protein Ae168Ps1_0600c [Pseudonocardia sp. Ae168_Ps1]OLL87684.1 hypothetical protein Ae263Ps1_4739 [Pseudonocardia sp. Ae263_Ps1]OLL92289.1 hypothetical protein Ae356Ps1_2186c [Pseudonocardia sp. Ae356_Ps1]
MTIEYVDAGKAFNHNRLSNLPHSAPDVCGSPKIVEGSLCRVSGESGVLVVDR